MRSQHHDGLSLETFHRAGTAGAGVRRARAFTAASVLALAGALSFTAPAHAQGVQVEVGLSAATAYPTVPPPDELPEDRPPAPGLGYYWVPGYWNWAGYWDWAPGYWMPHREGYAYVGPRFVWEGDRLVYYRPFWRGPHGYREYRYGAWRGAPPAEWRAHPRYEPRAWRGEPAHSTAWRRLPGTPAGAFRSEAPRAEHREAEHREAEHREADREHHEVERRAAPPAHAVPAHAPAHAAPRPEEHRR